MCGVLTVAVMFSHAASVEFSCGAQCVRGLSN